MNQEQNYNMIDWWKKVYLKNYAYFSGRARRAEFWYFTLASFLIYIIFAVLTAITGVAIDGSPLLAIVFAIFYLSLIILTLAVTVRRLHDINKSGWYYFISLIPLVGSIILLVWLFTDGDRLVNNYGDDPKNPGIPKFDFENVS